MVLTIDHVPNMMSLGANALAELTATLSRLHAVFEADGGGHALVFERYAALRHRGGNHAHVNVVPLPASVRCEEAALRIAAFASQGASPRAFQILTAPETCETYADRVTFALDSARAACQGKALRGADLEYVWFLTANGTMLLHTVPAGTRMDLSFPRMAVAHLLGCPERADWRTCQAAGGEEEETRLTEEFRGMLEKQGVATEEGGGGGGADAGQPTAV